MVAPASPETKTLPQAAGPHVHDEANMVVFFEMMNAPGTSTLHVTIRSLPGELEHETIRRVFNFIKQVDSSADLSFKLKDAPKNFGRGGGSGGPGGGKKFSIPENKFVVTAVARVERKNKDASKGNWSLLRAYGQVNGEEVYADGFVGNIEWQDQKSAVVKSIKLFPDFFSWNLNEKKPFKGSKPVTVLLEQHPQYKDYSIIEVKQD